jgi:hypothetical protein
MNSTVNNNSTKFMRAALGGLLLVLFMSGIFMVVEQSPTSKDGQPPAESNKKWFGTAYIILAGLLGIYYAFKNIAGNNSGGY